MIGFPALSLHQPWASAIPAGLKPDETRGWPMRYRGRLAIHASLTTDRQACARWPFGSMLRELGLELDGRGLPSGYVLAVVDVVACMAAVDRLHNLRAVGGAAAEIAIATGDYGPGRYAIRLANVRPLKTPIRCRGRQRLWRLPPDVAAAVEAQL